VPRSGTGAAGCRLPTKPLFSQLSGWGGIEPVGAGGCVFSGNWELRFARRNTLSGKRPNPGSGSTGISGPRLLKWLNSLYRPALPEGIRGRLVPPLSRQLNGASPSGKAVDFDSTMRRFESSRPSQDLANKTRHFLNFPGFRSGGPRRARSERCRRPARQTARSWRASRSW
jgi:hypothetical protein